MYSIHQYITLQDYLNQVDLSEFEMNCVGHVKRKSNRKDYLHQERKKGYLIELFTKGKKYDRYVESLIQHNFGYIDERFYTEKENRRHTSCYVPPEHRRYATPSFKDN